MIHADFDRLAWERLDGTISAEDDALLDAMLASDGTARKRFETIQEMARELSGVKPASPPAELRPRIDRALMEARPRWRRRALPVGRWRPQLVYLAAGMVLGAIAAQLLLPAPALDRDLASGSMVAAPTHPPGAVSIDLAGEGTLAIWRDGSLVNVDLAVREPRPLEVTLESQEGGVRIKRVALSGSAATEVTADQGLVRVRATGPGRSGLEVSWPGHGLVLVIRVTSAGTALVEREVRFEELEVGR